MLESGCGLQIEPAMLTLMLCFSLLCGFGPVCVIRRAAGVRLGVMSLSSCLSDGVFLCSCLLDLLPDYLTHARETFSRLGLALHFPLAEFIVSMGFLLVFVSEQMLLAFRDPMGYETLEKQALIDPHMTQSRDSPGHSHRLSETDGSASPEHVCLRVLLLVFCLCVCALVEGLSAGSQLDPELILQIGVTLFLRQAIMAFSLSVRMSHYGLRQAVASGCLILFSLSCPVGIGIRMGMVGMNPSAMVQLVRCAVEGLASGIFIYVSIAGLLWQESASPKHRIHKVTFLLTGFALVTAVLFYKV